MEGKDSLPNNNEPEDEWDIQEVENPTEDIEEKDGEIEWQSLEIEKLEIAEIKESARMRTFLVYSTMSLWGLWTVGALITQNPYLIVTSPPMLGLLWFVFRHYFPKQ